MAVIFYQESQESVFALFETSVIRQARHKRAKNIGAIKQEELGACFPTW